MSNNHTDHYLVSCVSLLSMSNQSVRVDMRRSLKVYLLFVVFPAYSDGVLPAAD